MKVALCWSGPTYLRSSGPHVLADHAAAAPHLKVADRSLERSLVAGGSSGKYGAQQRFSASTRSRMSSVRQNRYRAQSPEACLSNRKCGLVLPPAQAQQNSIDLSQAWKPKTSFSAALRHSDLAGRGYAVVALVRFHDRALIVSAGQDKVDPARCLLRNLYGHRSSRVRSGIKRRHCSYSR
jgi:hypothetical protein